MLRFLLRTKRFTPHSSDGDIGDIKDFLFDDETWTVRYMVVHTGPWLFGKNVLISPFAFTEVDWENNKIQTSLTQEQIKNSPDMDSEKPVSRKKETEYLNYYGYPLYWGGPGLWGTAAYPTAVTMLTKEEEKKEEQKRESEETGGETHLRSAEEVQGYRIHALNDRVGHVEEFLVEEDSWRIRYMVVETRNVLPGRNVILSPEWIREIDWGTREVTVDLLAETIQNSPEVDLETPITRDEEETLFNYYEFPRYW
jgi:hypothetical protein